MGAQPEKALKVEDVLRRANLPHSMKEALRKRAAELSNGDLARLDESGFKGRAAAKILRQRLKKNKKPSGTQKRVDVSPAESVQLRDIKLILGKPIQSSLSPSVEVEQEQVASLAASILSREIMHILSKSIQGSQSVTGEQIGTATRIVQRVAEETISKVLREFAEVNATTIKVDWDSGTVSALEAHPILPVKGYAPPSEVHIGLAAAEHVARVVRPDAIVAVNAGGMIIGKYLSRRLTKAQSVHWKASKQPEASSRHWSIFTPDGRWPRKSGKLDSILIVDDISRTGKTLADVRKSLQALYAPRNIFSYTIISSFGSIERKSEGDFSKFVCGDENVKMPYNSRGEFKYSKGVSLLGSQGADMSITDHEADLLFSELAAPSEYLQPAS